MAENRFKKNHPTVDPNDPSILTRAGREEPVKTAVEPVPEPIKEEPVSDAKSLLDGIVTKKPAAKSYGFYLSADVVAALEKLAKQNKTSKSKVLDTLLRNLLLNEK